MKSRKKRTIIIGLDGVPFGLLKDLAGKGVMPNTGKLISEGTFRKMESSVPGVSSVAWSSIITGANPGEHGIFGFTELPVNTYRLSFPNFSHLKRPPFWEGDARGRHIIINVPFTYPARRLNGILISGFVALDLEKAVYPDSILPDLKSMDYRIDADSSKAHESLGLFINDLNRTNEARISVYRSLWKQDWDAFMLVFTGTDRLMHFLWDAYEDEGHAFNGEFRGYFSRVDGIIGEVLSGIREEDSLLMLSDHGFEELRENVNINYILKKEGFLRFEDERPVNLGGIDRSAKAFALDSGRIYINLKDKYPKGGVAAGDEKDVIGELEDLFRGLEHKGDKVVKHVYRKDEIYKGRYVDRAPDLVLAGNKGFDLKAPLNSGDLCTKGMITGKHTREDAFLLVNRKRGNDIVPEHPNVCDVVSVMGRLNGRVINER